MMKFRENLAKSTKKWRNLGKRGVQTVNRSKRTKICISKPTENLHFNGSKRKFAFQPETEIAKIAKTTPFLFEKNFDLTAKTTKKVDN
jgi:hypothetical protein